VSSQVVITPFIGSSPNNQRLASDLTWDSMPYPRRRFLSEPRNRSLHVLENVIDELHHQGRIISMDEMSNVTRSNEQPLC
jgi:hypothetical protein